MNPGSDQTNDDPNSNERASGNAEKKDEKTQVDGQTKDESGKPQCQSTCKQEDQLYRYECQMQQIRTLEEDLDNAMAEGSRNKKVVELLREFITDLRQEDELSDAQYEATNNEKKYGDDILDEISSRIKDIKLKIPKGKADKEKEKLKKQIKRCKEEHKKKPDDWKTEKAVLEKKLMDRNENIKNVKAEKKNLHRTVYERQQVNEELTKKIDELQYQMQTAKDRYQQSEKDLGQRIQDQFRELQQKKSHTETLTLALQNAEEDSKNLRLRLSKLAGARLIRDNPNIADLSDANRPTKIAERYSELYDNEWTDAFEELHEQKHMEKVQSIQTLLDLLKATNGACLQITKPNREILKTLTSVYITLHCDLTHEKVSAGAEDHSLARSTNPNTAFKMDENMKDNGKSIFEESSEQGQEDMECEDSPVETELGSIEGKVQDEIKADNGQSNSVQMNDKESSQINNSQTTLEISNTDGYSNIGTVQDETHADKGQPFDVQKIKDTAKTIPEGFSSNVDTGEVSTEVVIDVKFSEEQMKTISDMRKLSAIQFETKKNISKLIAEKIAFERGIDSTKWVKVMAFITKCAELCWYMAIQEPPVVIKFHEPGDDELFDKDEYKPYTEMGDKLDYVVWPPLFLYSGGAMLSKGTAQGKK